MTADLAAQLSPAALKRLGNSNLQYDTEKLEQLAEIALDEQEAVVRAHLGIGLPWSDALVGRTLRSSPTTVEQPPDPTLIEPPHRQIERRKIAELKPNRFNAALFPDSLSDTSIALIAEDLARHGQRVPVETTPDGEIVDGERRWRGAQRLGWTEIDVVVGRALSEDELLDRVVDSCTSARQMTVREQANVFSAVCERLKREVGRDVGRQDQIIPKGIICLTPRSIKEAAAKRAGFSSTTLAIRAEAVFQRGTKEIQEKVREGSLTISAAYDQLPKRPKASAVEEEGAGEQPGGAVSEQPSEAADDGDEGQAAPPADTAAPTMSRTPEPAVSKGSDSADPEEPEAENGQEDEGEDQVDDAEGVLPDDPHVDAPDLIEVEETVNHHINAVCTHLTSLAARDYEEAVTQFDQLVEELRASLGEPPESDLEFESDVGENEDF